MRKAVQAAYKAMREAIDRGLNCTVHMTPTTESMPTYINFRIYKTPGVAGRDFCYFDEEDMYFREREGMLEALDRFIKGVEDAVNNYEDYGQEKDIERAG